MRPDPIAFGRLGSACGRPALVEVPSFRIRRALVAFQEFPKSLKNTLQELGEPGLSPETDESDRICRTDHIGRSKENRHQRSLRAQTNRQKTSLDEERRAHVTEEHDVV